VTSPHYECYRGLECILEEAHNRVEIPYLVKVRAERVCVLVDVIEQAEIPVFRTRHGHSGPRGVYMEPQRGRGSD
jgi:hypothetical protein